MTSEAGGGQNVDALVSSAIERLNRGELDIAEVYCRQALALQKGHMGALTVLGSVMHSLARFREAESLFTELTERSPQISTYWTNLGTARRSTGKLDAALMAYARAAELGDRSADFYFNVGLTHLERRDYEAARKVLAQSISLAPEDVEIRLEYARACEALGLDDEAVAALLGVAQDGTAAQHLQARIALQLLQLGESETAQAIVSRLHAVPSLDPRAALTVAQIEERLNRTDKAAELLGRVRSDPRTIAQGLSVIALEARLLQRENRHGEAAKLLGDELGRKRDAPQRHHDLFLLAKSHDALGLFDECFATLKEAHRSQQSNATAAEQFSAVQLSRPLLLAQQSADAADVASWQDRSVPVAAQSPVFVVGAPNSGKILVELMLDAHPRHTSSEGRSLMKAVTAMWGAIYPRKLGDLGEEQLTAGREKYWRTARRALRLGIDQVLIDTDPMNLLQLPAIRRLFPNAPILFVTRHPCDTLLSAYMQDFVSADLITIGASLQTLAYSYDKAMAHWLRQCELLGPKVHEISYEQLAGDFATQARALTDAVGLSWHDAMSRPDLHAMSKGRVASTSYDKAILPVSTHAVGRWKNHVAHFATILPLLQPYADRWNYSLQSQ